MACNAPKNFIGCAISAASRRPAILATFCADLRSASSSRHSVWHRDLTGLGPLEESLHHRADVADQRGGDGLVAVHLGRRDVDLDELGVRVPLRRIAVAEQPVQAGTDEHHDVGLACSASERAVAADCGWSSGSRPFAIDIGRYGTPVVSTNSRICSSACA